MLMKLLRLTFYSLPLFAFAANFTGPRAEVAKPPRTQNESLPLKVTIYKSHQTQFASASRTLFDPSKTPGNKPDAQAVRAYVQTEAVEHGVNPKLALWIVKHESHFNPLAKGDGEASRGLWQISKIYHPEVSDAAAFGVASSTEWSLQRIRSGKANEWSTYRFCRTLYEDCPF
jgi:soluble lytic murein transglycosylase-like protein